MVDDGVMSADVLPELEFSFLKEQGFLDQEPGEDAAAILAQKPDGQFALIEGAACPNNKRRAFPKLIEGKGMTLRLAGATVFLVAPNPLSSEKGTDEERVVLIGFDRREKPNGHFCASAQGGVGGGQTFFEGACAEIADELYLVGALNGYVVRVVPEGFRRNSHPILSADNPFDVDLDQVVECGKLTLVGHHDYVDGGYLSAMYTWDFPGVPGMTPLLAGSAGSYNAGWQDAVIPVVGSTAKVRVQGTLTAFPISSLLQGLALVDVPSLGYFQGTQGYMRCVSQTGPDVRPPFHPTLQRWAASL